LQNWKHVRDIQTKDICRLGSVMPKPAGIFSGLTRMTCVLALKRAAGLWFSLLSSSLLRLLVYRNRRVAFTVNVACCT
jgi:hypothetical protein